MNIDRETKEIIDEVDCDPVTTKKGNYLKLTYSINIRKFIILKDL